MTTDGRRDPRKPTVLQIRFKNATISEFVEKHSRDISRGGIFIKMKSPFPPGTLIKFDIRIAESSMIHGVGRVVWRRKTNEGKTAPAGMGVKFIKLDDKSRMTLEQVLAEKGPEAEAETPLFDDALPKPKWGGATTGKKPTSLPKPTRPETEEISEPIDGVSLEDDTRKIPIPDKKELEEEEKSDSQMMVAVVNAPPSPPEEESEDSNFLSGSKDNFEKDVDSALEAALRLSEAPTHPNQSSTGAVAAATAPNAPMPKATAPVQGQKKNKIGIFLIVGVPALLSAAGIGYYAAKMGQEAPAPSEEPPPSETTKTTTPPAAAADEAPKSPTENEPSEKATLNITTVPEGATVLVGETPQPGVTPMKLTGLPANTESDITVQLFGFISQTQKITPGDETGAISMTLKPAAFRLDITSSPPGAQIHIDDKAYGKTPRTMRPNTMASDIEIKLIKKGYDPFVHQVRAEDWVEDGKTIRLEVEAALIKTAFSPPAPAGGGKLGLKKTPQTAPSPAKDNTPPTSPESEPKTKPESEPKPEPAPEEKPKTAEPEPTPKPEPAPKPEPKPAPEPESSPKPEPKPEKTPDKTDTKVKSKIDDNPF